MPNEFTENDRRSLARAHERIDEANDKISSISELTIQLAEQNKYQEKRTETMEEVMQKHMDDEEAMWKGVDQRLKAIVKTLYLSIAIFSVVLVITSEGKLIDIILKALKIII